MGDIAGGGGNHTFRRIVRLHVIVERFPADGAHFFDAAQNGTAEGLIGIGLFLKIIEHDIVGRVGRLLDFLQNDVLFPLEFIGIENRVLQNIGQNIDGERRVLFQDLDIESRRFPRRAGVDVAADVFDFLGDFFGGPCRRPFESHVFEQVGDTVDLGGFEHRSDADPHAQRHGVEFPHFVGYDAQAARQSADRAHHAPFPTQESM